MIKTLYRDVDNIYVYFNRLKRDTKILLVVNDKRKINPLWKRWSCQIIRADEFNKISLDDVKRNDIIIFDVSEPIYQIYINGSSKLKMKKTIYLIRDTDISANYSYVSVGAKPC